MRNRTRVAFLWLAVLCSACAALRAPVPIESGTTFTAHKDHAGFTIDDFGGGRKATIRAASWLHLPGTPTFTIVADGKRIADVWRDGWRFDARRGAGAAVGDVTAGWEQQAVRLTLHPADGAAFATNGFARDGVSGGLSTLTRAAQTNLDIRGTYRAPVRDAGGADVGWLRVRISPYQEAARIYDATLPSAIPPELVAATVVALDAEIDWIEDHALDVYRGSSGASLQRSVPISR